MNTNSLIGLLALVVVVGGGVWFFSSNNADPEPPQPTSADTDANSTIGNEETTESTAVEVHMTQDGFVPASLTIKKGTTVTFINDTSGKMWVGADQHPSHTEYAGTSKSEHCPDSSGTAFDQCSVGDSYTFTFAKVGTWGYHNHVSAGFKGVVVVNE